MAGPRRKAARGRKPGTGGGAEPGFFSRQVAEAQRFYLDIDPDPGVPLAVVSGGWERCAPDYVINRRGFPFRAIEFVASGAVSLRTRGGVTRLTAGAVFSYGPGVPHALEADPDHPPLKYFLDFTGRRARSLLRTAGLASGEIRQVPVPQVVRELFDQIVFAGERRAPSSPAICASLLEALLLTIADCAVEHAPGMQRAFETYRRCREWIASGRGGVRSLEDAARECHIDGAYLCRLFRRFDRETPYGLIQRLRMQRAVEQLHVHRRFVKDVADELGYSDSFHFSRAFKQVFGIAPSEFVRRAGDRS